MDSRSTLVAHTRESGSGQPLDGRRATGVERRGSRSSRDATRRGKFPHRFPLRPGPQRPQWRKGGKRCCRRPWCLLGVLLWSSLGGRDDGLDVSRLTSAAICAANFRPKILGCLKFGYGLGCSAHFFWFHASLHVHDMYKYMSCMFTAKTSRDGNFVATLRLRSAHFVRACARKMRIALPLLVAHVLSAPAVPPYEMTDELQESPLPTEVRRRVTKRGPGVFPQSSLKSKWRSVRPRKLQPLALTYL